MYIELKDLPQPERMRVAAERWRLADTSEKDKSQIMAENSTTNLSELTCGEISNYVSRLQRKIMLLVNFIHSIGVVERED